MSKLTGQEVEFHKILDQYAEEIGVKFKTDGSHIPSSELISICSFLIGQNLSMQAKIREIEMSGVVTSVHKPLFGDKPPYKVGDTMESTQTKKGVVIEVEPNPRIDGSYFITVDYDDPFVTTGTRKVDD